MLWNSADLRVDMVIVNLNLRLTLRLFQTITLTLTLTLTLKYFTSCQQAVRYRVLGSES
jgi:hypothetical protein